MPKISKYQNTVKKDKNKAKTNKTKLRMHRKMWFKPASVAMFLHVTEDNRI